ncbi:VacJ family lipoprotein [Massilia sp. TS11]|uniref:MlaA family lipoprotein n=1 Tax=Massilia sp. TS11 TaxID=2908003 RepID=UPI001EDAC6B4|nr:VacJ family lipoprotein [Massilia sp. TS11]MCG2585118.1 VacJ family lipoprotein [Massilia sp. TS11]
MRKTLALTALALPLLTGCATTEATNPKDPFEKFNRAMFDFNDKVDQVALKPAATAYKTVTPGFVQTGVNNFFGNLADVWTAVNQFLQGKPAEGFSDVTRVALNSTFGLLGVLDIASEAGIPKHNEDFGQTLGRWGVPSGPYLMLPFLGASTVRDAAGIPLDRQADPWKYKDPVYVRNIGTGLRLVDLRATYLDATNLMEEAALDRYEFVRDSFLQRRESRINDGNDGRSKDDKEDEVPPPAAERKEP